MYDLLLIDMRMPQMSGYELYKEIRKKDPKIKVIFVTASNPLSTCKKYFPHSTKIIILLKPVEIAELIKRINAIIAPNLPGHL